MDEAQGEAQVHIGSVVDKFRDELDRMVRRATARTLDRLRRDITEEKHRVLLNPKNQRALMMIDRTFMEEMDKAGYDSLLRAFVSDFPATLPSFRKTYAMIGDSMKSELPDIKFTAADQRTLIAQQTNAKAALRMAVQSAANAARRDAMFSVGGMTFEALSEAIAEKLHKSVTESEALAATAISTYYRTIAALGYEKLENDLSGTAYYKLAGPKDRLNRPWCKEHLVNKTYTREQIEAMDNGQLPNPFLTAGGYRCRHQWTLDRIEPAKKVRALPLVLPGPTDVPEVPSTVPPAPPPDGGVGLGGVAAAGLGLAGLAGLGLAARKFLKTPITVTKGVVKYAQPKLPKITLPAAKFKIGNYKAMLADTERRIANAEATLNSGTLDALHGAALLEGLTELQARAADLRHTMRAIASRQDRIEAGLNLFYQPPSGERANMGFSPATTRERVIYATRTSHSNWVAADRRYADAVKALARINHITRQDPNLASPQYSLLTEQARGLRRKATAQLSAAYQRRKAAQAAYLIEAKRMFYAHDEARLGFTLPTPPSDMPEGVVRAIMDMPHFFGAGELDGVGIDIELGPIASRAGFDPRTATISMPPTATTNVLVHEMGHVVEEHPDIMARTLEFYNRRTSGHRVKSIFEVDPTTLARGLAAEEQVREATPPWMEPYFGKFYPESLPDLTALGAVSGQSLVTEVGRMLADYFEEHPPNIIGLEILSMGFEKLHTDPTGLAKGDPELFEHLIAVLQFIRTGRWPE